ncbi:MAG: TetR/AcrR family transcriptional regulator, partial [Solirubrobacterales bacterium]
MTTSRTPYQEAARELLRQTVFDAARDLLDRQPWSEITMADIATGAGVSRQTLYNEFGNRNEFGFAFVIHEAERFMDGVEKAVLEHVEEPRAAVRAARTTGSPWPCAAGAGGGAGTYRRRWVTWRRA